jgi:hypothetical protein
LCCFANHLHERSYFVIGVEKKNLRSTLVVPSSAQWFFNSRGPIRALHVGGLVAKAKLLAGPGGDHPHADGGRIFFHPLANPGEIRRK